VPSCVGTTARHGVGYARLSVDRVSSRPGHPVGAGVANQLPIRLWLSCAISSGIATGFPRWPLAGSSRFGLSAHDPGEPWWHRGGGQRRRWGWRAVGAGSGEGGPRIDAIGQAGLAPARPRLLGSPLDSSLPLCYNRTNVLRRGCLHALSCLVHRPTVAFASPCGAPASRQHLFCGTNPFSPCTLR